MTVASTAWLWSFRRRRSIWAWQPRRRGQFLLEPIWCQIFRISSRRIHMVSCSIFILKHFVPSGRESCLGLGYRCSAWPSFSWGCSQRSSTTACIPWCLSQDAGTSRIIQIWLEWHSPGCHSKNLNQMWGRRCQSESDSSLKMLDSRWNFLTAVPSGSPPALGYCLP